MKAVALLSLLLCTTPAFAQTAAKPAAGDLGVATAKMMWQMTGGFLTKAAEELPEADYAFKPTASVRSFGQQLGHIAGAQYMFCAAALGETGRAEDEIEKTKTSKADLVAALKASNEYCARAYAQSDAAAAQPIKMFGQDQTRMWALMLNATHNAEHYGNIVTYLRIKNIVPPSSRPSN